MDEPVKTRANEGGVVLGVAAAASQLRLHDLSGPLRIKGKSITSDVWRKNSIYCYGTLAEGKMKLRYRVPSTSMPRDGEEVVIAGTLVLSPLSFEVQLHGDVEGSWQPNTRLARPVIPDRSETPETIGQFLEQHAINTLGFITTDVGWGDIQRSAGKTTVAGCQKVHANFSDEDTVIAAIKKFADEREVKGIVIVRGGGQGLDEVGNSDRIAVTLLEKGLPFFTALGHSNNLMLLDKYADESFGTPSDFGHRLRSTMEQIESNRTARQKAARLGGENEQLKGAISLRERDIQNGKSREETLRQSLDRATKATLDQANTLKRMKQGLIGMSVAVVVLFAILLLR